MVINESLTAQIAALQRQIDAQEARLFRLEQESQERHDEGQRACQAVVELAAGARAKREE